MKKNLYLLGLLALLMASLAAVQLARVPAEKPHAAVLLDATRRTRAAFEAVRAERLRRGLAIDIMDDPNETGLIGDVYSEITTTLGNLEAKRSTTNPNVAAMLADMFIQLGLVPGDAVALNLSSSFPALNIASLCALDAMGIEATVIFSMGASTYGGNMPDFTYGDMENFLYANGLIKQKAAYFSLGGEADLGLEMDETVREAVALRLEGHGYTRLTYHNPDDNLRARLALYEQRGPVRCFVNVGGNVLSFGDSSGMHNVGGGILTALPAGENGKGLVQHYIAQGVPVIHLLNMKGLLPQYGLPIDPSPVPADGEGGVYYEITTSRPLLMVLALVNLLAFFFVVWRFKSQRPVYIR